MPEMVSEVDVFARVEHRDRDAMTKCVHVAAVRGQRRLGGDEVQGQLLAGE
jgi:hypothetical protein